MNTASRQAILDFETYLLMTMRVRLVNRQPALEAKLSELGLSVDDADRVHARVSDALGDGASGFEEMKKFLGADHDAASLTYTSILWPEFDFRATGDAAGRLESARYTHTRGTVPDSESPAELPSWCMDVAEFTGRFGPMVRGHQWPLFDEILPGYEEHEFQWNGERYGAGFGWGLFLYSAGYWPD